MTDHLNRSSDIPNEGRTDDWDDAALSSDADGFADYSETDASDDETAHDSADDPASDEAEAFPSGPSRALWEGDQGFLTAQQRRTYVALLKNRYISPATPGGVWHTLIEDETPFHSRLNDMFLELEIDRHHQVAYKVQARPEAENKTFPTVLHDQSWSREETILLVYLRMRFRSGYAGTEKVFVDVEEIVDHVQSYRPATDLALSRGKSTTRSAIETARKAGVLIGKEGAQRFQISPIIEVLLTDARIEQLLAWLIDQNGELDPTLDGSEDHPAGGPDPKPETQPLDLFPSDGDTP